VAAANRRGDLFDNADPHYAGEIGIGIDRALAGHIDEADLVLALNVRLGELNTLGAGVFRGYQLLAAPRPRQRLIHLHPDADELQRVYQADLAIQAGPAEALAALADMADAIASDAALDPAWTARLRNSRQHFTSTGGSPGPVDLAQVFRDLRAGLEQDAIVTVGAGAYAIWLHRYFSFHRPGTLFGPKSGAMGFGLPAAVGAALARPAQRVVALAGDGCFLMHGEELATAVRHQLRVLIIVINNQSYAAIRGAQLRMFGRSVGTELANPDFAAYARAFGAHGEQIAQTEAFVPALKRCLAVDGPSLIEIVVPKELGKPA
jgi:acetolactate synthase-1/2/3 large subunit